MAGRHWTASFGIGIDFWLGIGNSLVVPVREVGTLFGSRLLSVAHLDSSNFGEFTIVSSPHDYDDDDDR